MSPESIELTEDRQKWLERRRNGIGGSDAPAVLGLSPWKSPLALWAEKTGLVQEPNLDELEHIEWGHVLEEPIACKYAEVTGRALVDPGRFATRQHPDFPWMHCTIDREIAPIDDRGPGDLSIKNAGAYTAKDWEEEAPLPYQVQLQHELIVTGMQWGSFAVLIGGNKFAWLDVPRDEEFCSRLIELEEEFWDRVVKGEPPAADASESTKKTLLRLYPKDSGESRELPEEAQEWIERRQAAKAAEKAAQAEIQEAENLLKAAIGDATIGLVDGAPVLSWKIQHRKAYTVAEADFRVLREIKSKERKK